MQFKISPKPPKGHRIILFEEDQIPSVTALLSEAEISFFQKMLSDESPLLPIQQYPDTLFLLRLPKGKSASETAEKLRRKGAEIAGQLAALKAQEVCFTNFSTLPDAALHVAEGLALSAYQFLKYRSDAGKKEHSLKTLLFEKNAASKGQINTLEITIEAIYAARTLVNEPLASMSAEDLARAFEKMGKDSGFKVKVHGKKDLEKEGMNGILAVNRGSQDPPTFTVMEYKPAKPQNTKPLVLVGKGVVYDTGGLSLKPTPNSMDRMKSDMSGAALTGAVMQAVARLKLPLHIIALVPATDNRPGENAYVPGDVITMYSGTTVEVLNTDAEGRMLLADALHWAKRYKPALVFDFATLTGAASAAIGEQGIVCMGTADEELKKELKQAGERQYERLVEFPLWAEYGEQIKSDIADIKNVGGPTGGAITAGKFLEKFTDYPWMHFDIAGVSFATASKGYQTVGGTGYGIRMVLDFLQHWKP